MNSADATAKYEQLGLEVRHITDDPGELYAPHRHGGVYLFTLAGSAKVRLDSSEWRATEPGQEIHIQDDQLHEVVVGPDGWEYLFATTPEEMKRQGL